MPQPPAPVAPEVKPQVPTPKTAPVPEAKPELKPEAKPTPAKKDESPPAKGTVHSFFKVVWFSC